MGDDDHRQPSGSDGVGGAPRPVPSPWGDVVIPDDLSELAEEAAAARRELRSARRRRRWNRRLGVADDSGAPGVMGPLFIVVLAMVVALTSLFGGFLPYQNEAGRGDAEAPVRGAGQHLPPLTLNDSSGTPARLNEIRPAVILSVGSCPCGNLIAESAALARAERVPLVVVGQPRAPALPPVVEGDDPAAVRTLADPSGKLAHAVAPGRPPRTGTATVVLVGATGAMTQVLTDVQSAQEFSAGVRRLR